MTYRTAQAKLLAYVRDRLHNGEFTERGLARLIGISQPHVHNVLKGARNLSPEILDSILQHFQMSLLDLASHAELEAGLERRRTGDRTLEVPFLARAIGPGAAWPTGLDRHRRFPLPFRALAISVELVMARLIADPDMRASLQSADIGLLDTSERARREISANGLYVVALRNEALLRYVRRGAQRVYLANDSNQNRPLQWERLEVHAADLPALVKARVQWLGREQDRDLPMAQRGRFLSEAISR